MKQKIVDLLRSGINEVEEAGQGLSERYFEGLQKLHEALALVENGLTGQEEVASDDFCSDEDSEYYDD